MINYTRNYVGAVDIKSLAKVLRINFLNEWPQCENFENKLCKNFKVIIAIDYAE